MKNTKLILNLSYTGQCTKHLAEETQILLKKKILSENSTRASCYFQK